MSAALQVYLKKVELNGFKKRVEVENRVASGELPVSTLSLRQAKGFQPYKEALERAGTLARGVKTIGWGMWWAMVEQAMMHKLKVIPNHGLVIAYAKIAVQILVDAGVSRDEAVKITAETIGIPREWLAEGAAAGGAAAPAAAPGA
jgi:hypothetical protein